jgi:hypothetical protein
MKRIGDSMTATVSAIIEWQTIFDHTKVVTDSLTTETPWDMCEGYAHTVTRCGGRELIQLTKDDWGIYDYMRQRGASKQVARECVTKQRKRTLAQLVDWYENGWEWWGVKGNVNILGKVYEDSLWAIDSYEYAEECREEIARNIAYQLKEDGFTVTGVPAYTKTFRNQVGEQNA